MRDDRAERLADILIDYSIGLEEGDTFSISGACVAEPLMLALYRRALVRGAHPLLRPRFPAAEPLFYRLANEPQLEYVWEPQKWMVEHVDASVSIISETNTRQLSTVDPARQVIASRARRPLLETAMRRAAEGKLRWSVTLWPTEAHAMDAEMSLEEYEGFYYGACRVDAADPMAEWRALAEHNARLVEWMKGRNEVHIEGPDTDLTLEVGGRTFIPADGKENFPDGEIFTGPVEDRTNGHVTFSYPAIYGGQSVEGARLELSSGKVVRATAAKNERFLVEMLDTDPGARVLGELGIGTNYGIGGFTGESLLDEKIGGTIHLALGASYPETGGTNESAVHWDMVCDLRDGGRVTVDGDILMEDGKLLV